MKMWCLELRLQMLSELLIRQVGKSNVQWFSYPFLPPTTFSGLVASLLVEDRKNYIELNDGQAREVSALLPEVFSVGAYPDPKLVRRNRHYRQHLGEGVYNYEEYAWAGNKKLSVAEYFWTPELRGFLLAQTQEQFRQIADTLAYKVTRVGKKGIIKVRVSNKPYEVCLRSVQNVVPSTIAPIEMLRQFAVDMEILTVPLKVEHNAPNNLIRKTYPCVFGQPIFGEVYVKDEYGTFIPKLLVDLIR
jgi:hypothetical protein